MPQSIGVALLLLALTACSNAAVEKASGAGEGAGIAAAVIQPLNYFVCRNQMA